MKKIIAAFVAMAFLLCIPFIANATVIFEHLGNADPTTEGWMENYLADPSFGPVSNDGPDNLDAWRITDANSQSDVGLVMYTQYPTWSTIVEGNNSGWKMTFGLRVVETPDTPDYAIFSQYFDSQHRWLIDFGSEADGDPIVRLQEGEDSFLTFTLQGGGNGYHLYELIYDPATHKADLFIDGTERISDYGGWVFGGTNWNWGAGHRTGTGQGNWNLVRFETGDQYIAVPTYTNESSPIPEPSTILLLGSGLLGLASVHRKTKL